MPPSVMDMILASHKQYVTKLRGKKPGRLDMRAVPESLKDALTFTCQESEDEASEKDHDKQEDADGPPTYTSNLSIRGGGGDSEEKLASEQSEDDDAMNAYHDDFDHELNDNEDEDNENMANKPQETADESPNSSSDSDEPQTTSSKRKKRKEHEARTQSKRQKKQAGTMKTALSTSHSTTAETLLGSALNSTLVVGETQEPSASSTSINVVVTDKQGRDGPTKFREDSDSDSESLSDPESDAYVAEPDAEKSARKTRSTTFPALHSVHDLMMKYEAFGTSTVRKALRANKGHIGSAASALEILDRIQFDHVVGEVRTSGPRPDLFTAAALNMNNVELLESIHPGISRAALSQLLFQCGGSASRASLVLEEETKATRDADRNEAYKKQVVELVGSMVPNRWTYGDDSTLPSVMLGPYPDDSSTEGSSAPGAAVVAVRRRETRNARDRAGQAETLLEAAGAAQL